jgi:hypothetical protein
MRVEAGAVVDEFDLPGIGRVVARHSRIRTGNGISWACMFTVMAPGNTELAVVHRLSAPTLAEARRAVRSAVDFLGGRPAASTAPGPPLARRATDRPGQMAGPSPSVHVELPHPTSDVQCGVVPTFPLPASRLPADHLPAPLS